MVEDRFTFTVDQPDAVQVQVYDAPRPENRLASGVRTLFREIRVERMPNMISWGELREVGAHYGVPIDPRDMYHDEDERGMSWVELPSRLAGLSR